MDVSHILWLQPNSTMLVNYFLFEANRQQFYRLHFNISETSVSLIHMNFAYPKYYFRIDVFICNIYTFRSIEHMAMKYAFIFHRHCRLERHGTKIGYIHLSG